MICRPQNFSAAKAGQVCRCRQQLLTNLSKWEIPQHAFGTFTGSKTNGVFFQIYAKDTELCYFVLIMRLTDVFEHYVYKVQKAS
jgi:hypothetical protein